MPVDLEILDRLLGQARKIEDNNKIISGLLLAQIICRRASMNAFDKKQMDIVLEIMEEISNTISDLTKEVGNK